MTPPANPTDRDRIIELEKRVKELQQSEEMSFGCFEMIADDLAFFDPKTDRSAVPPMMLNDWLRHVVREARSEGDAAGYSRCRGEHAMPTGDETQGFEAGHRLAAVIALSELHRACVLPDIDNDTFDGHLAPYVAQFISNWERRGDAAGYERGRREAFEEAARQVENSYSYQSNPPGWHPNTPSWPSIPAMIRSLAAAPPKPEQPK